MISIKLYVSGFLTFWSILILETRSALGFEYFPKLTALGSDITQGYMVVFKQEIQSKCNEAYGALFVNAADEDSEGKNWISEKPFSKDPHWFPFNGSKQFLNISKSTQAKNSSDMETFDLLQFFVLCIKKDIRRDNEVNYEGKVTATWIIKPDLDKPFVSTKSNRSYYKYINLDVSYKTNIKWEEILSDRIITRYPVDVGTLYTNTTYLFACVPFFSGLKLEFWIELSDRNQTLIRNGTQNQANITTMQIQQNIYWGLNIQLPIDAEAIHCTTAAFYSTLFYSVETRFKTKDLQVPKIVTNTTSYEFYTGQSKRQITCFAEGEPQPITYAWTKNSQVISSGEYEITTGKSGENILTFPLVEKSQSGYYTCNASNALGNDQLNITVTVQDDPSEANERHMKKTRTAIIVTIVAVAMIICVVGIYYYYRAQVLPRGLSKKEIDEFFQGKVDNTNKSIYHLLDTPLEALPYNEKFEIDKNDVELDYSCILGSGEFAMVIKGFIPSQEMDVAVKIPKTTADVTLFKALLSEVKIMSQIGHHINVVQLVGAITADIDNRNIHICMDFCELGSVDKYLLRNRQNFRNQILQNEAIYVYAPLRQLNTINSSDGHGSISTLDLIRWSAEVANGMHYLSSQSIIHADLAARNILLKADKTAKISDFGLSKQLFKCSFYLKHSKSPLPWRWMALESLQASTFSTQSDIWSYGVTLWEFFTIGEVPFLNEEWNKAFVNMLVGGGRLRKPNFVTSEIYSKMLECWNDIPSNRPSFMLLQNFFQDILKSVALSDEISNLYDEPISNEEFSPLLN